jgi:Zn-finger nucleic acid-binding protein
MSTGAPPRDRSRCLFCGARLDARVVCPKCKRDAPEAGAVRAAELDVSCPRCFIHLDVASQPGDAEFLYCVGCHGCFVPPGEWGLMVEHAAETTDDAPLAGEELKVLPAAQGLTHGALHAKVACPVCRVDMERAVFPGATAEVDICASHGLWFDAAELVAVLRESARPQGDGASPDRADRRDRQRSAISTFARLVSGRS